MPKAEMSSGRFDEYNGKIAKVIDNVEKVMIGKSEIIQLSIVSILCGGHTLLEDVPGVGKTMLVKALAKWLGCSFKRIQFTPDLLPSDVTGMSVYNQKTMQFEYRPGPIMGNVVLADEINRTSPKTQAALLEAMEEGNVTIDGETHSLPTPFFVMATQNPIEYEGTFPLPEAQLDRFLIKLRLGYPQLEEEVEMLSRLQVHHPIESVKAVISSEELKDLQQSVRNIYVEDSIRRYIVRLTEATRTHPKVYLGASPRGSIALFRAAQALALVRGRQFVVPDDVKDLAAATLGHRVILKSDARLGGLTVEEVLQDVLNQTPVPVFRRS
ncbi:MAG: MoxR family ATPase [Novibacillus thermophilus]